MERNGKKRMRALADLRRLIAPLDVVYHVGNLIFRRSLRYTMLTVGLSVLGLVADRVGLPIGLTVRQAVLLPLTVGALTLVGGYLMKTVPSLISSRLSTVAQASDLNLMEDYRKSEVGEHLDVLWDRVFARECELRMAAGAEALPGWQGLRGEPPMAAARAEFLARARKALCTAMPQIRQMHLVGIDLRYLEDWRDGAYLDRSDTKLTEQFDGNTTLLTARRAAGMSGARWAFRIALRRMPQRFWFSFITRIIAIRVGVAVEYLNRRYDTDLFNTQVLLWPGEESGPWLHRYEGAAEEVVQRRRRLVRRVFGPDAGSARDVLDRMLYPCFALATELRMRFDPDYCDGCGGNDVMADLEAEGRSRRVRQQATAFAGRAREDLECLRRLLGAHRPDLLAPDRGEALRAVRVAFHVDADGLKRTVLRLRPGADDTLAAPDPTTQAAIDRAVAQREMWTRLLVAVRVHHELTRLCRAGYAKLVQALAYQD